MRDRAAKSLGAVLALLAGLIAYLLILDPHGEDAMHRAAPLLTRLAPVSFFSQTNSISFASGVQKASSSAAAVLSSPSSIQYTPPPSSSRQYSSTTTMASKLTFSEAVKHRRTIYQLTKQSTISDDRIKEIATQAIKDVPSSFNSQSARLVVLVKEKHDEFWGIVENILKAVVPSEQWEHTASRLKGFQNAYGTVSCHIILTRVSITISPMVYLVYTHFTNHLSLLFFSPKIDPFLRRPRAHQGSAVQIRHLRRQVPSMVRAHDCYAPVRAVDGPGS